MTRAELLQRLIMRSVLVTLLLALSGCALLVPEMPPPARQRSRNRSPSRSLRLRRKRRLQRNRRLPYRHRRNRSPSRRALRSC